MAKLKRLPPHQRKVLGVLVFEHVSWEDGGYAFSFNTLSEWTGLDRHQVSRACKALRRYGFLTLERGLFTEDGEVAGSGYALTKAGERWWKERETPTEDGSQTSPASDGEVSKAAQPLQTTEHKDPAQPQGDRRNG